MSDTSDRTVDGVDRFMYLIDQQLQSVPNFKGSKVTVALSGGADSVALCHFMYLSREKYGITLRAAHLNHGLRGKESDEDEQFVTDFCSQRNITLVTKKLSWEKGCSPGENELRRLRYLFLWDAAQDGFLLTAHTCTDSCETLLLHLSRGSRLAGMRGISSHSGRLLRPMVDLTRSEIEAYCARCGLAFRTDSSNLSDAFARNRIRHIALPALESVNPSAQKAMNGWMQEADEIYRYLEEQVSQLLDRAAVQGCCDGLPCKTEAAEGKVNTNASLDPNLERCSACGPFSAEVLRQAHPVLVRYALKYLLSPYADCSSARLQAAETVIQNGGALDWCDGIRLRCHNGIVTISSFSREQESRCERPLAFDRIAACAGEWQLSKTVQVRIRQFTRVHPDETEKNREEYVFFDKKSDKFLKINKKDLNKYLDYDTIIKYCQNSSQEGKNLKAELRFRMTGDFFCKRNKAGTKSLKKWMNEISCPVPLRSQLPLAAIGSTVIWLAGSGTAEAFSANPDSEMIWEIDWKTITTDEV